MLAGENFFVFCSARASLRPLSNAPTKLDNMTAVIIIPRLLAIIPSSFINCHMPIYFASTVPRLLLAKNILKIKGLSFFSCFTEGRIVKKTDSSFFMSGEMIYAAYKTIGYILAVIVKEIVYLYIFIRYWFV